MIKEYEIAGIAGSLRSITRFLEQDKKDLKTDLYAAVELLKREKYLEAAYRLKTGVEHHIYMLEAFHLPQLEEKLRQLEALYK